MKAQTEFIHWLRHAYVMERARELTLTRQRDDEKAPPLLRQQAGLHRQETQHHVEAVAACASERFEIACFPVLRASAERLGLREFAVTCDDIIHDDKRMVEKLESELPQILNAYLDSREMEKSATERARDFMEFIHLKHRDY